MLGGRRPPALRDGRLHVLRGGVDIAVEGELDGDRRAALRVRRAHLTAMPAMVENSRSSGVATEDAMVSGLAPGNDACTWMVG